METLVDLSIREYQIRIFYAEQVVHVKVHLDTRNILNKLQNRHSTRWNVDKSPLSRHFGDDLWAHLYELMVIVRQTIKKHSCHINVWFFCVPAAIMAWSKPWDQNLSGNFDRVVLVWGFEECLLDTVDDLVTDLQILFGDLLILVDLFDQLLNVTELDLGLRAWEVDGNLWMELH